MIKKITFLNTAHLSLDDRIFYHQAKSLSKNGFEIMIISTKEEFSNIIDNILINSFDESSLSHKERIKNILYYLNISPPDIIICDSPLGIISSNKFKKKHKVKIIYDITEWYPSKKNLRDRSKFKVIIKFFILFFLNLLAGLKSDSFIFGEYYKSIIFRNLFFWKKFIFLPYYPDLNYIKYFPLEKITTEIKLLYSGIINTDKGIDTVIKAIDIVSKNNPEIQLNLNIIGSFPTLKDQIHYNKITSELGENVHINIKDKLPFLEFCKVIGNTHLFFDLRKIDIENSHCLPIKLFYYLACGRPVIYSNLRSIKKEIQIFNFGYLCNPSEIKTIASHINDYINRPEIYVQHANNALSNSKKYNWKVIENDFISFIEKHTKFSD